MNENTNYCLENLLFNFLESKEFLVSKIEFKNGKSENINLMFYLKFSLFSEL